MEPFENPLLEIIELINLAPLRLMVYDLDRASIQGWQNHIALEVARVIRRIDPGIGPGY